MKACIYSDMIIYYLFVFEMNSDTMASRMNNWYVRQNKVDFYNPSFLAKINLQVDNIKLDIG